MAPAGCAGVIVAPAAPAKMPKPKEVGELAPATIVVTLPATATLTIDGVPANIPAATGASASRLLGSLTPGSTLNWARCLAWMATQAAPVASLYDT